MTAPAAPRGIEAPGVPVADLEALREHLPVTDPDRHALDTVADDAFAHLAPGYPSDAQGVAS